MIVLGRGKESIKNYFTQNDELIEHLEKCGKKEYADVLRGINGGANIVFATQEKPLGSGDAVLQAEKFTGNEAFALAWGDDLMYSEKPVMGQLTAAYESLQSTILGVKFWAGDDIVKYGVADVSEQNGRSYLCRGIIEKPPLDKIPSRLAALGRYVLTPDVYDAIRETKTGLGGELQLTDTLNDMCKAGRVYAYDFEGIRYDMGDKFGSVKAIVEYALRSDEYGAKMKDYLKELAVTL